MGGDGDKWDKTKAKYQILKIISQLAIFIMQVNVKISKYI